MFERNKIDNADQGLVSVEITLTQGTGLIGKIAMPAGRNFFEFLSGASLFVEFETLEGERKFLAKSSIEMLQVISVPRGVNLNQRLRDLDGFDPYSILGLDRNASWDDTRTAFHCLAKVYHPDRYATAELPDEVKNYLSVMARRINAAYATLETAHAQRKNYASQRQEPIYTSPQR